MPSKMSWFNKEMIMQIVRSTGWISIVYFLGLLFILPIQLMMMYSEDRLPDYYKGESYTLFQVNFELQLGLLVIVPVILAVFLFRFLHVKQASDLMHSLPLKREKIFHHYAITGIMFLTVPVAVITLMILILRNLLDLGSLYSLEDIFYWAGTTIVITLLLYTASVMIAMMTGISAVHAVLAYIFLFFPVGFVLLLFYNLKILLYGFPSEFFLQQQLERMSPITYATSLNGRIFQWSDAIIYFILAVAFYLLALLFYKKRNVEQASEAIAFPKLRLIFKYGVTFCTMLVGGTYFSGVSNNNISWIIFGYVIGAVFGYFIAEMVLQKTWRIFARLKGLAVFAAVVAILVIGIKALGIYENRVPDLADIQGVQLTNEPYWIWNNAEPDEEYYRMKPLKEEANITAVRRMHQQILADRKLKHKKNEQTINYFVRYELKNGSSMTREYQVNERLYDDFFKSIYESKEYKQATKPIFKIKDSEIKSLNIRANGPMNKTVTLSNPEETKEVLEALRKDVLAESYEDSLYFRDRGSIVEIYLGDNHSIHSIEIKPTYQNISNWLKEKGLTDRVKVTGEDLSHVLVVKGDVSNSNDLEISQEELESKKDSLDIKEKRQMEQLLDATSAYDRGEYKVIFYYKFGDYVEIMSFDEEHAPDFVKRHFR
ncbi:DUF6449 domain-containing protein [Neobacillus kokaensis]|uniref:DUF6449 domain-containing protein n=1 Tax=Neobacillus kokaensis TaxID=2759023 RepID=A0ABQ3N5R1_9BACI|nr:DUF6449 domain-containing protein [Neobacillus kokaensis]GHH99529.1 hypothetical protein AM1BK_30720 [Neobacillus kokaensis]